MSPIACLLLGAIVGIVFGFALGWLFRRGQAVPPDNRLAHELRQQLAQREGELAKVREQATAATTGQVRCPDASGAAGPTGWLGGPVLPSATTNSPECCTGLRCTVKPAIPASRADASCNSPDRTLGSDTTQPDATYCCRGAGRGKIEVQSRAILSATTPSCAIPGGTL